MVAEMTILVDERVSKFVQARVEAERKPLAEVLQGLVQEGYEREIERLHALYARGDITLRGMSRRLGVSYREVYQMLEEKGLTF